MPPHLLSSCVGAADSLAGTFKSNCAKWHKSCRNNFSARQLGRKSASAEKRSSAARVSNVEIRDPASENTGIKRVCTRSEFKCENPLRATVPVCLFCDMPEDAHHPLHEVSTLDMVDKRVQECALVLSDNRLLAKLATGDMVAIEAKYHANCLAQLYNRRRSFERERFKQFTSARNERHDSIAFAELTAYINDIRQVEGIFPVFKLVDLKNMYTNRLQQFDASAVTHVNSTRLKEKLLAYFPEMSAHNDGRDIVLAFEGGMGAALSKACNSDADDDAIHLARAAEIVRQNIFDSEWKFENSLYNESQERSVPQSLLTLISMILEGPSIDIQLSEHRNPAALSIAQLVAFNSVRRKRSSTNRVLTVVRHAKDRETPLPLYVGLAVHAAT